MRRSARPCLPDAGAAKEPVACPDVSTVRLEHRALWAHNGTPVKRVGDGRVRRVAVRIAFYGDLDSELLVQAKHVGVEERVMIRAEKKPIGDLEAISMSGASTPGQDVCRLKEINET